MLVVVLYFLDDNLNNLYNQECCLRCFGCRIIFLGRQLEQLIQQSILSPLFWLSCYIIRTTAGTTYTTKKVVPVVLVVVLYLGRQQEQLIQPRMLFLLCWLSCIFLDDNRNNLYNKESCLRCSGCRVYFWTTTRTTYTTKYVVSVVLVVVYIFGRQLEQFIQQRKLSPLFWLSCYILGRQREQLVQQSMLSPLCWLSCIF